MMDRKWWLLAAAVVVVLIALAGCVTVEPDSSDGSEPASGSDGAIAAILDLSWDEMSGEDKDLMCVGWNGGLRDTLIDAFFSDWDAQYSRAEVEPLLIEHMNDEC